jgi:hypothetical protein
MLGVFILDNVQLSSVNLYFRLLSPKDGTDEHFYFIFICLLLCKIRTFFISVHKYDI